MLKDLVKKDVVVLGLDPSVENFKNKYPGFNYIDADLTETDEGEKIDCCYIVVGRVWKKYTQKLEAEGYVFWKDIFPDWIDFILEEEKFFHFEKVKKYCRKDPDGIADILEYLSRYKKLAAVYANCQVTYVSLMLQNVSSFTDEYILCRFLPLQIMFEEIENGFSKKYMSKFSLFIYQNVSRDNSFGENLSTYTILPMLKESCIKVSFPFAYFKGYFPQYIKNPRNDDVKRGEGHAPYGDVKIQKFLEDGLSIEETAEKLEDPDLFSEEEIMRNTYNSFYELEKREETCDVIISDFIRENYQSKYLFYTPTHPTNITQAVVVKRILDKLGLKYRDADFKNLPENNNFQMYIYPCVRKKLGLTFKKDKFWMCKESIGSQNDKGKVNAVGKELTIKEYVAEYARCCFPELNENTRIHFRKINIAHLLTLNESLVTERKFSVMEMYGDCVHLSLYLTIEVDFPKGVLIKIHPNYAPATSYITTACVVGKNEGLYPMRMYTNGECIIEMPAVKKGNAIIIDTTWFMLPKGNVFQMYEEN